MKIIISDVAELAGLRLPAGTLIELASGQNTITASVGADTQVSDVTLSPMDRAYQNTLARIEAKAAKRGQTAEANHSRKAAEKTMRRAQAQARIEYHLTAVGRNPKKVAALGLSPQRSAVLAYITKHNPLRMTYPQIFANHPAGFGSENSVDGSIVALKAAGLIVTKPAK